MIKPTKNPQIEELTKSYKDRSFKISNLSPPQRDGKRYCVWCNEVQITKKNQKYCSEECSLATFIWGNPQKDEALYLLLIGQDWKCQHCNFDYKPMLEEHRVWNKSYGQTDPIPGKESVGYFLNYFKHKILKPNKPEVDHIIPISKGGQSVGLENVRVLCYTCHKAKSKKDNSGPRKKKNDSK